jgi:hypothetical protein
MSRLFFDEIEPGAAAARAVFIRCGLSLSVRRSWRRASPIEGSGRCSAPTRLRPAARVEKRRDRRGDPNAHEAISQKDARVGGRAGLKVKMDLMAHAVAEQIGKSFHLERPRF